MSPFRLGSSRAAAIPAVPEWGKWRRRCFVALVSVLELALVTGVVVGLIVLSRLFESS